MKKIKYMYIFIYKKWSIFKLSLIIFNKSETYHCVKTLFRQFYTEQTITINIYVIREARLKTKNLTLKTQLYTLFHKQLIKKRNILNSLVIPECFIICLVARRKSLVHFSSSFLRFDIFFWRIKATLKYSYFA